MKRMLYASALAGLCALAVSCSRGDRAIAKVGSQKVTIAEFEQFYQAPAMAKDTAEVSAAKRKVLDQLVEEKLLLCEALAKGYDKDTQTVKELGEIRNNVLLDWFYREEFIKKNRATDGAVKDMYKKLGMQVRARHILLKTEAEAKDLMAAIKDKKTFDRLFPGKTFDEQIMVPDPSYKGPPAKAADPNQVPAGMKLEKRTVTGATKRERFMIAAKERSQEGMTAARGGDLSWFSWGQIAPGLEAFQDEVFKLKPGGMSDPVKSPYGYHLIMVDSTKKTDLPPFSQIKDQLKAQLDQQAFSKAGEKAQKYVGELLTAAKITLDTGTVRLLSDKQMQQYGTGPNPFPDLAPGEAKRTLATYAGGALTCQDLSDGSKFFFRGGVFLTSADSIRKYAERMISRQLLVNKARGLGLERLPKVKLHIALKSMDKLAGAVYLREIQDKISVSDEQVAAYFQSNRKQFFRPAQAYVDLIVVKTGAEASQVAGDLRKGANFAAVARERSIDESRQAGGYLGPIPREYAPYPEVAAKAFAAPVNSIAGPFPVNGGYAVIKVSRRDPARQPEFSEVKDRIKNVLLQGQNDLRYQELITTLKAAYPVSVDAKALAAAGQRKDEEQ